LLLLLAWTARHGLSDKSDPSDMEAFSPKSCKYNPVPDSLNTRAFAAFTGETRVHDVFGFPSTLKRHIMRLDLKTEALLTVQVEVARDTPANIAMDAYRRGQVGNPSGRILVGRSYLGAGGDDTKAFLHGLLGEKDLEVDIVFDLISVELASKQVDSRVAEARCYPVRLDVTAVPVSRAALHWPVSCPAENVLPRGLVDAAGGSPVLVVKDGAELAPLKDDAHYAYRFGDERPWSGFERALWSGTVEIQPRMHRFVRFFMRASFRFSSGPLQLAIELFDLKDTPDSTALAPKCELGCLGGVPVYNGQVVDHAMPTGFRYKLWLLAAGMTEWTQVIPETGKHCIEFDFDYSIRFEERMTPFEIGPAAWMCQSTQLPMKIVQTSQPWPTDRLDSKDELVAGRSVWIRDRFGFPPHEVNDLEHAVEVEVSEPSVFRATTHQSDGVDVFIALAKKGESSRVCKTIKHPGQVPRQTIFCILAPGSYTLTFFAEYPLGGIHPCSDFWAQVALRPVALASQEKTQQCISEASDLAALEVKRSHALATMPKWTTIKVPISFERSASITTVWSHSVTLSEEDAMQRLYLRMVVHSDYVSSDLRFQVRYEGKYVADTQVTSHGYADMIGPLDAGSYFVTLYYVSGSGGAVGQKLCSTSMVDLRLVSRSNYGGGGNGTAAWLCTSTRVPPPDMLAPQADEQVLVDSEYVIPNSGGHTIRLKFESPRLIRVSTTSTDADFTLELWTHGTSKALVATGMNALEVLVGSGQFSLKMKSSVSGLGSAGSCPVFVLELLLQPKEALPLCPWAPSSNDQTALAVAQRNAADHIGGLLLDLVPRGLSKELVAKPPVTLWMSQGMEKTFDLSVDQPAAIRIDVSIQPPFLPLEINLRRKRASGKLEPPIAQAQWTESRLLLMQNDLPTGEYVVEFKQPRKYFVQSGSTFGDDAVANLCAHLTVKAEVGIASKDAVNTMRAELLDLPDLLAVQPLPASLNTVGWFGSSLLPVVGTNVYSFKDNLAKTTLKLEDRTVIRLVCEPADLSNADIEASLVSNGQTVANSDNLGQLVADVPAGTYELNLRPKANSPFLVTLGLASFSRLKDDFALQDSGRPCSEKFPALASGMTFPARGWSIGPTLVRLRSSFLGAEGVLAKIPVVLKVASIIFIEAGSALPIDLVRIALQVPEGLWIGEQRGVRNSLELELPPGEYSVQIAQPKPLVVKQLAPRRCLEFSVRISARPVSPDSATDAAEASSATAAADGAAAVAASAVDGTGGASSGAGMRQELAPREEASVQAAPCFAMGTVPLPLDLSDPTGGSRVLGGPLDAKEGRLLVRSRVMLTDMHDGRKKVFLKTGGQKLQMKIGIMLGTHSRLSLASQLTFAVQPVGSRKPLDPVEAWTTNVGWERVYILEGSAFWLAFHHPHRERSESACLHFGLEIEVHPVTDMRQMMACPSTSASPEDLFPTSFDVPSDSAKTFRYSKPTTFIRQSQNGFLTKTRFTLATESFVSAELGFNFFSSHAEMDVVPQRSAAANVAMELAETEFLHSPIDPVTTQLVFGRKLPAGDYVLRVADDHYPNQLEGSTSCFPFSFELRIVPALAPPTIVSVQPHPSVPIARGVDLVLTLRFSEPPAGSIEDVVRSMSLGNVQANAGGSLQSMTSQYASSARTSTVQASTAEDHLVWVIGFSADVLRNMDVAKFVINQLRSNVSKRLFRFNPPTYSIVDVPRGLPWNGAPSPSPTPPASRSEALPPATVTSGGDAGLGRPQAEGGGAVGSVSGDVGAPRPEGGAAGGDVGAAWPEGGSARLPEPERGGEVRAEGSGAAFSQAAGDVGSIRSEGAKSSVVVEDEVDEEDHRPRVQEWNPVDVQRPSSSASRPEPAKPTADYSPLDSADDCPAGTVRSAATGICEPMGGSSVPVGYRTIMVGCGLSAGGFLAFFFWPRLRRLGAPSSRFGDIGARTAQEEMGLMQGVGNFDDDDDDML